jgi:hypothetical protein
MNTTKTRYTPSQQARYEARQARIEQRHHERMNELSRYEGEIEDDAHYEHDEYELSAAHSDYTHDLEQRGILPTPIDYQHSSSSRLCLPASDIDALRAALERVTTTKR